MAADVSPILLDNCAISACFVAGAWNALVNRYKLETVEEVASEAATGSQNREIIDPAEFRKHVVVHDVTRAERLAQEISHGGLSALDDGERDLWVHALGRTDGWILCGPDTASVRFGVRAGYSNRLISLEKLLKGAGFAPKGKLALHQTEAWLQSKIGEFKLELAFEQIKE